MICSVHTLGVTGIRGSVVTAECYISNGLPGFDIVGLPDAAVKEARERVRAAAKSSGMSFPVSRITVNLAPAGQKKAGTHYDLPILLSILSAAGSVRRPRSSSAFLGEVSLDGLGDGYVAWNRMKFDVRSAQRVCIGDEAVYWWALLAVRDPEPEDGSGESG